jgi:hypothetical protein
MDDKFKEITFSDANKKYWQKDKINTLSLLLETLQKAVTYQSLSVLWLVQMSVGICGRG